MKRLDLEQISKEKTAIKNAVILGVEEDKSKYIYSEDNNYLRWSRLLSDENAHETIRVHGIEFLKGLSGDNNSALRCIMKHR